MCTCLEKGEDMAQLSLYMDEASMAALRADAAKRGVSISSFARDVLVERDAPSAHAWENGWPPGYFDLYGSIPDFPIVEDLEAAPVDSPFA